MNDGGLLEEYVIIFSGGKAQPSFSGKHSNASAKRLAVLEVPLGMSLRVEEKIIIYYYFSDRGLRDQFDFEGSFGCACPIGPHFSSHLTNIVCGGAPYGRLSLCFFLVL